MTNPDERDPALDADPTGIRDLLRALPDPGPMPASLVTRIAETIAREQSLANLPHEVHVPRDSPRTSRRWHYQRTPAMVAAAVVAAFLGLGAIVTSGMPGAIVAAVTGGGSTSAGASVGSTAESAGDSAEGAAEGGSGGAIGVPTPAPPSREGTGDFVLPPVVTATNREWTLDALAAAGAGLLNPPPGPATDSKALSDAGTVGSADGARACASALGLDSSGGLAVDLARHGGTAAAAIVTRDANGSLRVAIVRRTCGPGRPGLLEGPRLVD